MPLSARNSEHSVVRRAADPRNYHANRSSMAAAILPAGSAWHAPSLEREFIDRDRVTAAADEPGRLRFPTDLNRTSGAPRTVPQPRPPGPGLRCVVLSGTSDGADVLCLRALLALRGVELHSLVVVEALVTVAADRGEVDEDVVAAAIGCDEAEALFAVEPLHGALGHAVSP